MPKVFYHAFARLAAVPVSPISAIRFFTRRGLQIMQAEILLIWLPAAALAIVGAARRGWRRGLA